MDQICDDLHAEYLDLRSLVEALDETGWDTPTPAEGWSIKDSIGHLAFFDEQAVLSHRDPEAFAAALPTIAEDPAGFEARHLDVIRGKRGAEVLDWWDLAHADLVATYRPLDPRERVLWFGPPMGARSKVTARLMETWAHGQDVAEAIGVTRLPTERLRHVCHLAVRARPFSYMVRDLRAPEQDVHVSVTGPSGDEWTWGEPDAADRITGSALDFALVATQRRHRSDTDLVATGAGAKQWLSIIQAFAGPPGPGRPPRPR